MSWKDLFKSKEQRAAEEAARLEAHEQEVRRKVAEEEAEKARLRAEFEAEALQAKMDSSTPWYEPIVGADENDFLANRFRWNAAFIKDLLKKGHKGETDAEVLQAYLDSLAADEKRREYEAEREERMKSEDPWVIIKGEKIDPDGGGVELELDWNPAFIKYLRKNGFRGANDDILIQQWLVALDRDISNPETYQ